MTTDDSNKNTHLQVLGECLRGRRTIELFDDRPVEASKILAAIDLARWAPNHYVTEPWHFYVLGEESKRRTIELTHALVLETRDAEVARRKADRWSKIPGFVVVTCAVADKELRQLEDYAACCCAIHNFSLHLWQDGIGMKWTTGGITRDQRFYDALGVDYASETIVALIFYGYPRTVPEQRRRPVHDIVTRLP